MGMGKGMGGSRFGDRGGREGGSRFNDRGGREGCGPRLGGRMGSRNEEAPTSATANRSLWKQSYRTTFIKPNLPSHLQPKKKEEPVLPAVEAHLLPFLVRMKKPQGQELRKGSWKRKRQNLLPKRLQKKLIILLPSIPRNQSWWKLRRRSDM
eukprot:888976_1